jgi:regulation of enolase protein 1 (concanavalin A-like superfamily)
VTTTWSRTSGPGTATFANAAAVDTTATFSVAGTYVLRLTASDGTLSAFDETTVTVSTGLPVGWTASDIGTITTPGSTTWSAGVWTIAGSGADIAGTQDQLRFASTVITGDVMITARVDNLAGPSAWSIAGVMIRETADAGSRHATTNVTTGRGLQYRRRLTTNGTSALTNGPKGSAPYWVRLERVGSTVVSSTSSDGVTWKTIRSETVAMGATIQVGLAVCSRSDGQLAIATFSNVTIVAASPTAQ